MPVGTSGDWDIEIQAVDGTWLPLALVLDVDEKTGVPQPKTLDEAISAASTDAPLSEWLDPRPQEFWAGGIGMDYDVSPGCDTFSSPGYVLPGGQSIDIVVPATNNSASPIIAFAEYQGSLYCAQAGTGAANTARILRSTDKTGVGAGAFTVMGPVMGAGEYFRDLLVSSDNQISAGVYLWATSTDVNGSNGRLHRWNGVSWMSTAALEFGTWGRNRLAQVMWTDQDGVSAIRMVAVSSNRGHIAYTKPGGDPLVGASWIEGVQTGSYEPGSEMVAARKHVWQNSRDGFFDINELGESPNLTSYTPIHQGLGLCVAYLDGYVYRSFGTEVDRIKVDSAEAVLQEAPGICSPGWATRAESPWLIGWTNAMLPWNGGLLVALFSLIESRTGIYWGKDRSVLGVETPNPLVWHGPFAIGPANETVSRLFVTEIGLSSETWLWAATFETSQTVNPKLVRVSLPTPGGAFANLRGGGSHRYANGAGSGQWQPYCLPGESIVVAPNLRGASTRSFDGEVVILRTATDDLFTSTPNHPVLTDRGWVAAGEIREGDRVVHCLDAERVAVLLDPDHHHVPATIEQVANALRPRSGEVAVIVPSAPEYFHGDGAGGDVHIVRADRLAQGDRQSTIPQQVCEQSVQTADVSLGELLARGPFAQFVPGRGSAPDGSMGAFQAAPPSIIPVPSHPEAIRIAAGADGDAGRAQPIPDGARIDPNLAGDLGSTQRIGEIESSQSLVIGTTCLPRVTGPWIAMLLEQLAGPGVIHPKAYADLCERLAGLVSLVQVVNVERRQFSGHVYNLETKQGWYVAQNIITHNCRLEGLPDTVDDKAARKFIYQITYGSLGLSDPAGTKLTGYIRADPTPSQTTWGTGTDITVSPTQAITPAVTAGNKLQYRVDLFSPNGASTPPKPAILDSIRPEYWKTSPDVNTLTFLVEYGPGVVSLSNSDWGHRGLSVDQQTDKLLQLCRGDRTVLRDRQNNRRVVKVKHALPRTATLTEGPYGKRITAKIILADLGPAS